MKIIKTKPFKLAIYIIILYSILILQILLKSYVIPIIFDVIFIIAAIILLRLFYSSGGESQKKANIFLNILKALIYSFIIVFPLIHFFLFASFFMGQAPNMDFSLLIDTIRYAIIPSLIGTSVILISNAIYILIKKKVI